MNEEQIRRLERELAEGEAVCSIRSYSSPLRDNWREMEWEYLAEVYPGRDETRWLRKCWKYAVVRGLIKVRRRNQFQVKGEE